MYVHDQHRKENWSSHDSSHHRVSPWWHIHNFSSTVYLAHIREKRQTIYDTDVFFTVWSFFIPSFFQGDVWKSTDVHIVVIPDTNKVTELFASVGEYLDPPLKQAGLMAYLDERRTCLCGSCPELLEVLLSRLPLPSCTSAGPGSGGARIWLPAPHTTPKSWPIYWQGLYVVFFSFSIDLVRTDNNYFQHQLDHIWIYIMLSKIFCTQ